MLYIAIGWGGWMGGLVLTGARYQRVTTYSVKSRVWSVIRRARPKSVSLRSQLELTRMLEGCLVGKGRWVGGWVEEDETVRMRCWSAVLICMRGCVLGVGGWVGGWVEWVP